MKQEEKKLDRRVRKTRAQLLEGLTQLMMEKDVKNISVKELADLVDINRGTFYLHYRDVFDMLECIEDELFHEFNTILDENFATGISHDPRRVLHDIFSYLAQNKNTVKALMGPHGDLAFVNRLKNLVKERLFDVWKSASPFPANSEYYFSFLVSGCIGIIETWIQGEFSLPPDKLADLANEMVTGSMTAFKS